MSEPKYLVCERTGGVVPHAEGSDEILCDRCSHPVSVPPACFNWVSRGVPVVCTPCSETMESTYMRVVPSLSEARAAVMENFRRAEFWDRLVVLWESDPDGDVPGDEIYDLIQEYRGRPTLAEDAADGAKPPVRMTIPVLDALAGNMLEAARRALPGVPDGTPEHRLLVNTIQTCEQFLAGRSGAGDDVPVV